MNEPAVIIRLPLEGPPRVGFDYLTEGEGDRMVDWFDHHPAYLELLSLALKLARENGGLVGVERPRP